MRPPGLVDRYSAGGVVFRPAGGGAEVALISVKGGAVWTLPKGLVDKGESVKDTALREVREETGLSARIIEELGEVKYWYYIRSDNCKCRKTVMFYLMEYIEGNVEDHDSEVDDAAWVPLGEAPAMLTYGGDLEVLKRAAGMIRARLGVAAGG